MSQPQQEGLPVPVSNSLPSTPPSATDHPSPPSSAGSIKRRPQDDILELVRKAKASRYAQPMQRSSDDNIADTFERDLSCAICSEVLTNPVACIDCLHNFCGSCLVPWFERSNTCPTCRRSVKSTQDNHSTAALVGSLLDRFPDKKRDPEELKELGLIYKPGQKIDITVAYNDEDANPDGDDGEEEEEEEEESHIIWPPCLCCTPDNPFGFTCPCPIPSPNPVTGFHVADVYSYRNHLHCCSCPNTFPTTWKDDGWKCENCSILYCGNLFICALDGVVQLLPDQAASIPPENLFGMPNFRGNVTEMQKFEQWRVLHNLTIPAVAFKIYTWLLRKNNGVLPMTNKVIREQEYVCKNCVSSVIQLNFLNWWCSEKVAEGFVDERPRCWYGRECRTQFRIADHAARLAHAWEVMPVGERQQAGGSEVGAGDEDRRGVGRLADAGNGGHGVGAVPVADVVVAGNIPAAADAPAGDAAHAVLANAVPANNVPAR